MSQNSIRLSIESDGAGEAAGGEQRRRPRKACPSNLTIYPLEEGMMGEGIVVQSENFSTMGLGMRYEQALPKGMQFLVQLAKRSGPPLPLVYTVVHCRPMGGGIFQIGAELVSVLDMDEYARRRQPDQSIAQYMCEAVVGETD